MARPRPAAAAAIVLCTIITAGDCLLCNVCIPKLEGDNAVQKEIALVRANISRTFSNRAESEFQECGSNNPNLEQPQANCPTNDESTVCLGIKHANWYALTCGTWSPDRSVECEECCGGALVCSCANDLCNSRAQHSLAVPTAGLLTSLLAIYTVW